MSYPLELTGLTKVFPTPSGPFIAVKDVNALIETGEFVILGHSGCGKSTVLSIVAGLDKAISTAASSSTGPRSMSRERSARSCFSRLA